MFCSGSSTSSSAEEGSPRKASEPTLSISSSTITGLRLLASFKALITRPGMAPT